MISKAKLKELSTYRTQKQCDSDGVFVVEGRKMCAEALHSPFRILTVCATSEWLQEQKTQMDDCCCYEVSPSELERISSQQNPNAVWMLLQRQPSTPIAYEEGATPTLVLDHLQDPGNLGTIIRTADWFGIRHIVCSHDTVSCFNPKVVQATMGGIFRTAIEYRDLPSFLTEALAQGRTIYGALLDGENVYSTQLQRDALLVIGNESKGISPEVATMVTQRVTIPNIGGTCESLNASVATAILCAEMMRPQER